MLILGEGPTQGLDDTTLTAETIYPTNLILPRKRFVLNLNNSGNNSFLFGNKKNKPIQSKRLCNKKLCIDFS